MVLKPQTGFLSRFRLSVDYYNIRIASAIGTLGAQNIANRCFGGDALSCSLITRDANNVITTITDVQQNVNRLIPRGIDS